MSDAVQGAAVLLEVIELVLPATVQLHSHLYASKDHFLASLKVDAQLDNVAIVYGEGFALLGWRAEADVVKESTRRALDVFDVPFAVLGPKLAVSSADDLALEAYRSGGCLVSLSVGHGLRITLRVTTDADNFIAVGQCPADGRERQGWSRGPRVVVG